MAQLSQCVIVSARVLGLRKILRRKPNSMAPAAMAGIRERLRQLKTPEIALQQEDRILLLCTAGEETWSDLAAALLLDLLTELSHLQFWLATEGFFLSGAIVWGPVLHDRTQGLIDLSGPGVRRARHLTRSHAAPCLLFDPDFVQLLLLRQIPVEHAAWRHIQDNGWGQYFLDYLSFSARVEENSRGVFRDILKDHKQAIEGVLHRGSRRNTPRRSDWLTWLIAYHDRVVRHVAALGRDEAMLSADLAITQDRSLLLSSGGFQSPMWRLIKS